MNPFEFWIEFFEETVNLMLEPLIDAYWQWEYENVCREME